MRHHPSANKTTPPRLAKVYPRERLFRLMDKSLKHVWISGPGGSGKSTLAASYLDFRSLPCLWYLVDEGDQDVATLFHYLGMAAKTLAGRKTNLPHLTPDHIPSLKIFSRRYFEKFFAALRPPFALVFDDYQEIADGSIFHDVIQSCLLEAPEGIHVVIISRKNPPAAFSRLRANNLMEIIGYDDLFLTSEETAGIVHLFRKEELTGEELQLVHNRVQGWVAGLMLMLKRGWDRTKTGGSPIERTSEVFDYFAEEVFTRTDEGMREFLLKTALLPAITPYMAEELTGAGDAARILDELNRNNFFTEKRTQTEVVYRYHPLFREFLLKTGEAFFPSHTLGVLKTSAFRILYMNGRVEEAALVAMGAGDWGSLSKLILEHAERFVSQGRGETVRAWLEAIPTEVSVCQPQLLYWHAVALSPIDPATSLNLFRRAFDLFRQQKERMGMLLSWAGMVNASQHVGEFAYLDQCITILDEMLAENASFPTNVVESQVIMSMSSALIVRQPQHPDISQWVERAFKLTFSGDMEINQRFGAANYLIGYHLWMGNFTKVALILDLLRGLDKESVSILAQISIRTIDALADYFTGSFTSCIEKARETLRMADETAVHIWDFQLWCHSTDAALGDGDIKSAEEMLEKLALEVDRARKIDASYYYSLQAWKGMLLRDYHKSYQYLKIGLAMAEESGFVFIIIHSRLAMAELEHCRGNTDHALALLAEAKEMVKASRSSLLKYASLVIESRIHMNCGKEEIFIPVLREAMSIGREHNFINYYGWQPSVMTSLCLKALEEGIEVDYVRDLIRRRNLVPEAPPLHLDNWPWPVRIQTLGDFVMEIGGKSASFSGKVQKKPLELLKTLIACGGRNVPERRIAHTLWPDAEGDTARGTLKVTLSRLRDLLGSDQALRHQDGRISIDPRLVWIDVWAYEHLLVAAQTRGEAGDEAGAVRCTELAQQLYHGHFLAGEDDSPWAVSLRKRFAGRFVLNVTTLATLRQKKGDHRKAIEIYLRGLEIEELAEELYQNLMTCYYAAGFGAEAAAIYHRCRLALAAYGLKPSEKTQALYRSHVAG